LQLALKNVCLDEGFQNKMETNLCTKTSFLIQIVVYEIPHGDNKITNPHM